MAVFKRRNRQVAFRVSEDEYAQLLDFCSSAGVRSISDFARLAVTQFTNSGDDHGDDPLTGQVRTLDLRIRHLDRRLEDLSRIVKAAERIWQQSQSEKPSQQSA